MDSPPIRTQRRCWVGRIVARSVGPAIPLLAMLAGCQSPPTGASETVASPPTTVEDARLPDASALARLSQVDGSSLGWGEGSEESVEVVTGTIDASTDAADADEAEAESLILARPSARTDPAASPMLEVAALQATLSELAANADDPTPYELAAALLPLVAVPELVDGTYPEYAPRIGDLSSGEELLVLGTADFASTVRTRLDAGESPMVVLASEIERWKEGLREDAGLRISTVALCSAIRGFGDFDEMDPRLPTRADRDALVYVALDDLDWEAVDDGMHRWRIDHRIELRQLSDGFVVDPGRWTTQTHALPEPSRDAFFWVRIRLPIEDLSAGRYGLKIRVREPSTGREVERSLNLELVPPRMLSDAAGS